MDRRGIKPTELRNPETTLLYTSDKLREVGVALQFFENRLLSESRAMFERLSESEVIFLRNDLERVIKASQQMQIYLDHLAKSRIQTKH